MDTITKAAINENFENLTKSHSALEAITNKTIELAADKKIDNALNNLWCAIEDLGQALERKGLELRW